MDKVPLHRVYKLFYMFLEDAKLFDVIKQAPSIAQMISNTYNLMSESDIFPKTLPGPKEKSDKNSEASRNQGNAYFRQNENIRALEWYTKAVGEASVNSAELALAYANRSAVNYALGEYHDTIIDIDRALNGKYPKHLRYKLLERKGKSLAHIQYYSASVQVYKEALIALEANFDKTFVSKMRQCIEQEINDLKDQSDDVIEQKRTIIHKLTHEPSSYIECASKAIDIEYNPEMGRLIVASVDINPGDVIAIEQPFASMLLPSEYLFFCYSCKKRCHSMLPCLSCTNVFFCNKDCRTESWNRSHKVLCKILPTLIALGCSRMELLAVEILMRSTEQGEGLQSYIYYEHILHATESPRTRGFENGKYSCNKKSTYHLETNDGLRSYSDILPRLVNACCILYVLKSSSYFDPINKADENQNYKIFSPLSNSEAVVGATLLKYLLSVPCNAHELSEMRIYSDVKHPESAEIGSALYPFLSLINHSCDPNIVRTIYNGDLAVVSAIQFIKKGEQIFDNYGYHHAVHEVEERQESLCSQYFFVCKCQACLGNWPVYKNLPKTCIYLEGADQAKVEIETKKFTEELKKIQEGETKDKLPFLYSYLKLLHDSVQRPYHGYSECQESIKECLIRDANHYFFK